jgi:hypothetical protein
MDGAGLGVEWMNVLGWASLCFSINFQLHGMLVAWPPFEEPRNKASQPLVPAGSFCQAVPYCPCNWAEDSELLLLVSFSFFFLLACYSCLGSTPVRSNRRAASDFWRNGVHVSLIWNLQPLLLAFRPSFAKTVLDALLVKSRPSQLSTLYSAEIYYYADQSPMPCRTSFFLFFLLWSMTITVLSSYIYSSPRQRSSNSSRSLMKVQSWFPARSYAYLLCFFPLIQLILAVCHNVHKIFQSM